MLYLVDGYNVTHADPATAGLPVDEQRDELVRRLAARGANLLGAGRIVVVFDGPGPTSSAGRVGNVEVVFSTGGSADDAIVSAVERSRDQVVVVTHDRGLTDRVKAVGGRRVEVRPAAVCFAEAKRATTRRAGGVPRDVGVPRGANDITRELKDLWLDAADGNDGGGEAGGGE